jgi:hypothetical protein
VTFAGTSGPRLNIFNEFFNYTYISGGYNLDPSRYINLEVPARQIVRFNWGVERSESDPQIKQYRWAMDISNLDDQTPRTDERTDTAHWSQGGLSTTSAAVGPFFEAKTHTFFIEAEDVNGLKSLGIVSFRVVVPTFQSDLLIVNDTRLLPDNKFDPLDPGYDPTPPFRSQSSFLSAGNIANLDFMTPASAAALQQNSIIEDVSPDPDNPQLVSMLDTLMISALSFSPTSTFPLENEDLSQGGRFYHSYPVMTYYHGLDNPPFVMTGFDLWTYTRKDIIKLVDFVFQQVWGLPKEPIVTPARLEPTVARVRR